MYTPRAIPIAMEKNVLSSTTYLMGMMDVTAAKVSRIATISNHDGQVGFDAMKP
jgi:hypothetical protein